jgi:hypothetical protein
VTAHDFKSIWRSTGDKLTPISLERLVGLNLEPKTIEFLTQAGLPISAAPFLSFADDSNDRYKGIARLTNKYDLLEEEFNKWIVIGSCGNGDPIALNTDAHDEVARLDHENNFNSDFFNSSLETLAGCLVVYRQFGADIRAENGDDALLNSDFTDLQFETLKNKMIEADFRALSEQGFWKEELDNELANREYFRKHR